MTRVRERRAGSAVHRALHTWATLVVVAAAVSIAVLTLTPLGALPGQWWEATCGYSVPCSFGHAGLFVLLGAGLAAWYATSAAARRSPVRSLIMLLLVLWLIAGLDEWLQQYVGRDTELDDWFADVIGALAGLFGASVLLRLVLSRSR